MWVRLPILSLILAALAFSPVIAGSSPSPERQIRELRAQYNAAIAAHDPAGMRRFYLPGFTVLPGSSGAPYDAEGAARRMAPTFADPTFIAFVRTPIRVVVSSSGKRAAETGTWVGRWRKADGEMRLTGVYQAMWLPTPQGWRLRNESFISLKCVGSQSCPDVD